MQPIYIIKVNQYNSDVYLKISNISNEFILNSIFILSIKTKILSQSILMCDCRILIII